MERSVNVNAAPAGDDPMDMASDSYDMPHPPVLAATDQGPCLYFGPAGQRCKRTAMEGGFCSRHQPGSSQTLSIPQVSRRAFAAFGLLAVLWPVLADVIREIIRFFR